MMRFTRSTALAAALLFTTGAGAEGIRSASMLANTCAGCHGTNGASVGLYMPTIAGLDVGYLNLILTDYQKDLRKSTIMGRIMRGYTDQEIQAIAHFFAEQPWSSNTGDVNQSLAAKGEAIHENKCETCHEDNGRVQDDKNPRLAGQWPGYLEHFMDVCRSIGERCPPRKMGARIMEMSDEDLQALAHFYASQR